jgi:succinate dehydrogenase assembly factor 1
MVRTKPEEARPHFLLNVRYQFRTKGAGYTRRDAGAIEYLIRAGHRQVDMLSLASIRDCSVTKEMKEWAQQEKERARAVKVNTPASNT